MQPRYDAHDVDDAYDVYAFVYVCAYVFVLVCVYIYIYVHTLMLSPVVSLSPPPGLWRYIELVGSWYVLSQ